jgi:predicted Zn-dependent protease
MKPGVSDNPADRAAPEDLIASIENIEHLLAAGDVVSAKTALVSLDGRIPRDEAQWKRLYSLCHALNDRTRAQIVTENFLRLNSDSAVAHLAYARIFISIYDARSRVREAVASALKDPKPEPKFWQEVAEIQSAIQDHEGVCRSAPESLTLAPNNIEIREILIYSLGVLKRLKEVKTECNLLADNLRSLGNKDPLRWARLSRIAAEAGAAKAALDYVGLAEGYLQTVNYEVHFEIARALLLTNQADRAKKHLDNLFDHDSQNVWLWKTILNTALSVKLFEVALKAIEKIKAIPFQDPEFLHRLSLTEKDTQARQRGLWNRIATGLRLS